MKKIFIGKGVQYFRKKQNLRWSDIQERIGYKRVGAAQRLGSTISCNTKLIEELAKVFNITPAEFVKACESDKEDK